MKQGRTRGKVTDGESLEVSHPHHMIQAVFADRATTVMLTRESQGDLCYQVSRVFVEGWRNLTVKSQRKTGHQRIALLLQMQELQAKVPETRE
jgi:hypothetical protein